MGYIPYIIGRYNNYTNADLSFLKNNTNLRIVKKFQEIKKDEFDILMVNSEQTWRKFSNPFYDNAFLCFAKNWKIIKLAYGVSLGYRDWKLNKTDEKIAKYCLKDFKGISVREKGSIGLIQKHLGIKPLFVLDPTFLIDKKYYLNIIATYKTENFNNKQFLFTYLLSKDKKVQIFIKNTSDILNYSIYNLNLSENNAVLKFLYGINNCKAVVTNSYHATIFSIIFKKPFLCFVPKNGANARFDTLKEIFSIKNRIIEYNQKPNINLLIAPLKINRKVLKSLQSQSINFIKTFLK